MTITQDKIDSDLGWKVHEHLVSLKLETPFNAAQVSEDVKDDAQRMRRLQDIFYDFMHEIRLDMNDDSLTDTPKRLAKMYGRELFSGLNYDNFPKATTVTNKMGYDEMLIEKNIQVYSTCEHHLLPIIGGAWVAYIPKDTVVGLSKLNRIVDFFCRRPQIQERLTAQIFHTLQFILGTEDVAVIIEAEHMCVKLRGVEDACSDTISSQLGGVFKTNPSVRAEFIALSKGLKN